MVEKKPAQNIWLENKFLDKKALVHSSFLLPPTHVRTISQEENIFNGKTNIIKYRVKKFKQESNEKYLSVFLYQVRPPRPHCLNRDIMSCQMSGRSGCHGWDKQENKRQSGCNVVCVIVQSIEEKQKHFFLRSVFFVASFHFVFLYLDKQDLSLSSSSVGTV